MGRGREQLPPYSWRVAGGRLARPAPSLQAPPPPDGPRAPETAATSGLAVSLLSACGGQGPGEGKGRRGDGEYTSWGWASSWGGGDVSLGGALREGAGRGEPDQDSGRSPPLQTGSGEFLGLEVWEEVPLQGWKAIRQRAVGFDSLVNRTVFPPQSSGETH